MIRASLSIIIALFAVTSIAEENPYRFSPAACQQAGGTVVPVSGYVTSAITDGSDPGCSEGGAADLGGLLDGYGYPVADELQQPPVCLAI